MRVSIEVLDDVGIERLRPTAAKARVRIVGPIDGKTCAACMQFVGNEYAYDDPRIQCFVNGAGLHPNCRHWAEEIAPGEEEPPPAPEMPPGEPTVETGEEYIETLLAEKNAERLADFFGAKRTALLLEGVAEMTELYEKDGTLKTLARLASALGLEIKP